MSVRDLLGGPAARGPLPGTGPGGGLRETASRYALLPLRLFLGVTFLYAGIDKYTDAGPFSAAMDTGTMESMLRYARDDTGARWLVNLALDYQGFLVHGVAIAEIAVGAAVLIGLCTRVAAACGALLSLTFWLTVSWSTDPYYLGADLPCAAGFLTLLLAGSGPVALDALVSLRQARRYRRRYG